MQKDELAKVKAKIKALTEKTVQNGCSEHEALYAAQKAGDLLTQYNLTMDEIDIREEKCTTIYVDVKGKRRSGIDSCITAIARFCDCKVWFVKAPRYRSRILQAQHKNVKAKYAFFGQETDVQMARYLYDLIRLSMEQEVKAFKHTDVYARAWSRRSAFVSFERGMASRVSARLNEMKAAHEAELAAKRTTGTALVVLKGHLVEQEFKATGIKLKAVYGGPQINHGDSYNSGREAGGRVNLNRPIEGGARVTGLIGHG